MKNLNDDVLCGVEEAASLVSTGALKTEIITRTIEEGMAFVDRPGFVNRIEEAKADQDELVAEDGVKEGSEVEEASGDVGGEDLEEAKLLPNEKKAVAAYAKAYVAAEKSKEGRMSKDAVKKTVAAIKKALDKDIAKAGFPSLWHFSKSPSDGPFVFRILFHANEKDKDPRGLKAWLTLNGFVNVYQTNLGDGDYEVGAVKNYADRKLGLALNKHLFREDSFEGAGSVDDFIVSLRD